MDDKAWLWFNKLDEGSIVNHIETIEITLNPVFHYYYYFEKEDSPVLIKNTWKKYGTLLSNNAINLRMKKHRENEKERKRLE